MKTAPILSLLIPIFLPDLYSSYSHSEMATSSAGSIKHSAIIENWLVEPVCDTNLVASARIKRFLMPFFKICQVIGFTLADSSRSKFKLNAFCNKSSQTYNISKIFFSCYLISNLDLFYSQILIDVFFFLSFFITFIA